MPRRQERVITKRTVDALSVEHRDAVFWDRDLPGFGIRVYPSGLKKYVVQSRGPGGSKRATLGRHGKLTADEARCLAAEANPWVIPGQKPDTHMTNLDDPWRIVRERAGIENVRIHDCRHSFASRALALGESLPVIAKLLGHSQIRTTARYAHLARDSVKASAARVAASIAEDFLKGGSATAKLPGRQGTDSPG